MGTHTRSPFQRRHSCHLPSSSPHQESFLRCLQSIHRGKLSNNLTRRDSYTTTDASSTGSNNDGEDVLNVGNVATISNHQRLSRRKIYANDGRRNRVELQDDDEGKRRVIRNADPFFLTELPNLPFRGPLLKTPGARHAARPEQRTSSHGGFVEHAVKSPPSVAVFASVEKDGRIKSAQVQRRNSSHNKCTNEKRDNLVTEPSLTCSSGRRLSRRHSCHGVHDDQTPVQSTNAKVTATAEIERNGLKRRDSASAVLRNSSQNRSMPPSPPWTRTSHPASETKSGSDERQNPRRPPPPPPKAKKIPSMMQTRPEEVVTKSTNFVKTSPEEKASEEPAMEVKPPRYMRRRSMVEIESTKKECFQQTKKYIRRKSDAPPLVRADETQKHSQSKGFRQDYELGDTARHSSHMIILDEESSFRAVSDMQCHDFVFVKRSNGRGWTYAIIAYKSLGRDEQKDDRKLDECLLLVMDKEGSTKMIKKKQWGECIRQVSMVGLV